MLAKLKGILGSGEPAHPGARKGRVDVSSRFVTLADVTGQGTMSKVYRVLDNESGQTACLKIQDRDKNAAAGARTTQEERPAEGAIGAAIVHPNVVRTIEYGLTTRDEHYMLMEHIDGVSLQHVRETIRLNLRGRLKLLIQAAEGFNAVVEAGFIHHDINPRNVLVNRQNIVKVIDFGLTIPNTAAFRKPGNRTGALAYMAPEVIRREAIDETIDIFAFGAMAYEFLTNALPYGNPTVGNKMAAMIQRVNSPPIDPAIANPKLPASLCEVLRKTLARKEDRWPSFATLAVALAEIRETETKEPAKG
ncbi:serine/threonine-protein kinase [Isosphaeraceae bacterium EP7]